MSQPTTSMLRSLWHSRRRPRSGRCRSASWPMPPSCWRRCLSATSLADIVTDQTSAHDALNGYVPAGIPFDAALAMRATAPTTYIELRTSAMARHMRAMLELQRAARSFDYGNNLRGAGAEGGRGATRSISAASCRSSSGRCSAKARVRSAGPRCPAIPNDLAVTDEAMLELFPNDAALHRWIRMAQKRVAVPGTARAHLLARLRRARHSGSCCSTTRRARKGQGADRDRPRSSRRRLGRVAESRDRGDDATAPMRSPTGRSSTRSSTPQPARRWVSFHHGGGIGIGYSHARGHGRRRRRYRPARREAASAC